MSNVLDLLQLGDADYLEEFAQSYDKAIFVNWVLPK
jgi:hypothetical protein